MKILIIDDEDAIRQITVLNIENIFSKAAVFEASNSKSAIKIIKDNPDLSLVISDYNMPSGNGDLIYSFLRNESQSKVPFILYSAADFDEINNFKSIDQSPNSLYLQKPLVFDEFKDKTLHFYNNLDSADAPKQKINNLNFIKIRISYFWRFNKTSTDIYLALNNNKFIKIINKNDSYDKSLIDKYVQKKQKYLYIKKEALDNFSEEFSSLPFLSFIQKNSNLSDIDLHEEHIKITTAILRDLTLTIGVSENTFMAAETFVSEVEQVIKKVTLGELFQRMRSKGDYLFDHCYILSCICIEAVKQFEWHNSKSIEKLCYAALFHDISQVNPELAMINSLEEAEIKGYTPDEVERFALHPITSANYVIECKEIDTQVAQIIKEHHENPQGTGFPNGLRSTQVSQLTAIFIISHQLVKELYQHQFDREFIEILIPQIKSVYSEGNYRAVFPAFEKVFGKITR